MDRNSAIGLTLIAALLLVYFYWFSAKPQPQSTQPAVTESPANQSADSVRNNPPAKADSTIAAEYGDLPAFGGGQEKLTSVETKDLHVVFTNKGGVFHSLELKNYKTYTQKPLLLNLVKPSSEIP